MKLLLLIVFFGLSALLSTAQRVVIERLYVESDYNGSYILINAGQMIPAGEEIRTATIDCAISELKRSGMFRSLQSRLVPVNGRFYLYLTPIYKGTPNNYRLAKISIEESLDEYATLLEGELTKRNVKPGIRFLPFSELSRKIAASVKAVDKADEKRLVSEVWIDAFLEDQSSIRLEISRRVPSCSDGP